ncbi:replication initiation protein [Sphingomonas sp. PAMC 26605]|uniref:replication initiation protein n=1 Tax=Sphingomonas sp. PAMC 26605 TaxID=1112214 RepID=UPI000686C383|nr:replication initiation protein [Sphingomonas sp. PAMC 26605]
MVTPTKQALADRADRPDELVASGRQIDMVFRPGQRVLSLRASKLWHLLVKEAGADLAAAKDHRMALADLYGSGIGHMTLAERIDALRELQTTLIEVRVPSPKVKGRTRVISEAMLARVERDEDDRGDLVWRFGETLRRVFADSEHWAVLSKRAVMAFESRYSLRLYELLALRSGLDRKTAEIFPLEDLRSRLGIPVGKLVRWQDVKAQALEPAIAEVNHLAGFHASYEPIKRGRAITSVRLSWEIKSGAARAATKRELDGSKVGRKARRENVVERIDETPIVPFEFPDGSIRYSAFAEIARATLPPPARDLDAVAHDFRRWAKAGGKPLSGPKVIEIFAGFCKTQKAAS